MLRPRASSLGAAVNSQLPSPNSQLPTPKKFPTTNCQGEPPIASSAEFGSWELGVASGTELSLVDPVLDRRRVHRREGPAAQIPRLQRVPAGGEADQPEFDLAGDALDAQRALIDDRAVGDEGHLSV